MKRSWREVTLLVLTICGAGAFISGVIDNRFSGPLEMLAQLAIVGAFYIGYRYVRKQRREKEEGRKS
jgi:hypothetical protein